jgi:sec-independent protein translocase protein TatA
MGLDSPVMLILIFGVILLMFGGKKIPELMKGLGKGVKEFKDAQNGNTDTNSETPNTDNKPKA